MGRKPSVTQAQRDHVTLLHREGKGRNAIAREVGVSAGTVTAIVNAMGGDFDRSAVAAAVQARQLDLKDLRTQLERGLLEDALRLRAKLWHPFEYVELGKDSGEFAGSRWYEHEAPEPIPADQLKLVQATAVAIAQSLKLTEANRETGTSEAKSMLGQLQEQLLSAFTEAQAEEADA